MFSSSLPCFNIHWISWDFGKYFPDLYFDSIIIVKLLSPWHQVRVDTPTYSVIEAKQSQRWTWSRLEPTDRAGQMRPGPVAHFHAPIFPDTTTETATMKHVASNLGPSDSLSLEQFVMGISYFISLCYHTFLFAWNARWVPQDVFDLERLDFENGSLRYFTTYHNLYQKFQELPSGRIWHQTLN